MRFLVIVFLIALFPITVPAFGDLNVDILVDGLNNPWEIVFGPDGENLLYRKGWTNMEKLENLER